MKNLMYYIGGAFLALIIWTFLRAKKKPNRKPKRRKRSTPRTMKNQKRRPKNTTNAKIRNEAGLKTERKYEDMTPKQKRLFNLAKARLSRKKAKA